MWRGLASNALTVFIVLGLALAGAVSWGKREWVEAGPLAQPICLEVPRGGSWRGVSERLVEQGAISSASVFRIGVDYSDREGDLKAGSFLVPESATMAQIVDIVSAGGRSTCGSEVVYRIGIASSDLRIRELDPATGRYRAIAEIDPATDEIPALPEDARYRIAIAEGATSWQIVDALSRVPFMTGEVGEIPAEGTLAPDSYEVTPGADRAELIEVMEENQEEILAVAWAGRQPGLPYETPEEALIMASIVEKETGLGEERPQVASVFVNRLRQGMRLQTDPTVIYGVTRGQGVLGRGIRQSELDRETPWNTYRIDGLPATPIANPGLAAIEAALNPDETPYLFFVADGTGGHAFAETLDEHNRNVAAWRAIEAERASQ